MNARKFKPYNFITGFCMGIFGFYVTHTLFPHFFHANESAESTWHLKSIETDLPPGKEGAMIKYGYILITETAKQIGPLANDENMRFAGNNLNCNNCHLSAGRKIGSGSFVGVYNRFPQQRWRENKIGTLAERINGCMERSMNGKTMDEDSEEIQAMIAYMKWLSQDVPQEMEKLYKGFMPVDIPDFKADTTIGKLVYQQHCVVCHQSDGQGVVVPGEEFSGYVYPPIAGPDSYNNGAGMNRVLTAAQFIKWNMPFGVSYENPILTDEQAYHVAAYINTFDRPEKVNLQEDFPDKTRKPVSTPYGPWTDNFSADQHKFGPFPPIIEYYETEYGIAKNK